MQTEKDIIDIIESLYDEVERQYFDSKTDINFGRVDGIKQVLESLQRYRSFKE
jgi:hypothetical protein